MENQKRRRWPLEESKPSIGCCLEIIAGDKSLITYRPKLNQITKSVTATILLQQILFWWEQSDQLPFYKFKAPCNHKLYKSKDSWCEELGFTSHEFDKALQKIACKTTKNEQDKGDKFVYYWTTRDRITYYSINAENLDKSICLIYQNPNASFTKILMPHLDIKTETTSETTSEITNSLLHKDGVSSKHLTSINKIISFWNNLPRTQKHSIPETDEDKITKTYKTISFHIDNLLSGKPLVRNKDNSPFKPYKRFLTEYNIPSVLHTMIWTEKDIIDMLQIFSDTQSDKSAKMSLGSVFWNNFAKIRGGGFSWFIHTAAQTDLVN